MRRIEKTEVSVMTRPTVTKPAKRRPIRNVMIGVVAILTVSAGTIFAATVVRVDPSAPQEKSLVSLASVSAILGEREPSTEAAQSDAQLKKETDASPTASGTSNSTDVPSDLATRINVTSPPPEVSVVTKSEDRIGAALERKAETIGTSVASPQPVEIAVTEADVLRLETQLAAKGSELFDVPTPLASSEAGIATGTTLPIDRIITGSIPTPLVAVEVAETETEILQLETKMAENSAENLEVVPVEVATTEISEPSQKIVAKAPPVPVAAPDIADGFQRSKATKYVNLRAGPNNDAKVISIVPANADILAEVGCRHWCSAVYKGKKGHIYRSFIEYPQDRADS